jgi:8-oxo-dGTP pyrophosphatase MutT (NUDIX family)
MTDTTGPPYSRSISESLYAVGPKHYPVLEPRGRAFTKSVVAFLLQPTDAGVTLLLTRRSARVRQPGDLCCPGGGAEPKLDSAIACLLRLPRSPMTRWPLWGRWCREAGSRRHIFTALLATALRECFEEIRLWPLGVAFLGMLPPQELVLFKRAIYPVVCWVPRQERFSPNWEVDAMVAIPLSRLLAPERYIRYRLRFADGVGSGGGGATIKDFLGFRYDASDDNTGVLWGATFRMTMDYLRIVHRFVPPAIGTLPVIHRTIGRDYLTGNGNST